MREHWPAELRTASLPFFDVQRRYNQRLVPGAVQDGPELRAVFEVLTSTSLETLPLVMMGSDHRYQEIAVQAASEGYRDPWQLAHFGFGALARRDYAAAASFFVPASGENCRIALYRALALVLAGRRVEAGDVLRDLAPRLVTQSDRDGARWLAAQAR